MRKIALTAVSTFLLFGMLGAGSLAIASERDASGGYKIGPLGQVFGANEWRAEGRNAYGFVPTKRPALKQGKQAAGSAFARDRLTAPSVTEPTYMMIQDRDLSSGD